MIDLLISSLKVGLGFIGLMTPAVIVVMWRQWKDFGEPRKKMQDIMIPEQRKEEKNNNTSRPIPPTEGSGVSNRSGINLKTIAIPESKINTGGFGELVCMAERLRQCEKQQIASVSQSPKLGNVFSEPTPQMLYNEKELMFGERELIMLCMMYLTCQDAKTKKEGKSPR